MHTIVPPTTTNKVATETLFVTFAHSIGPQINGLSSIQIQLSCRPLTADPFWQHRTSCVLHFFISHKYVILVTTVSSSSMMHGRFFIFQAERLEFTFSFHQNNNKKRNCKPTMGQNFPHTDQKCIQIIRKKSMVQLWNILFERFVEVPNLLRSFANTDRTPFFYCNIVFFLVLSMHQLFVKLLLSPYPVLNQPGISVLVSGLLHPPMLISLSTNPHQLQPHLLQDHFPVVKLASSPLLEECKFTRDIYHTIRTCIMFNHSCN